MNFNFINITIKLIISKCSPFFFNKFLPTISFAADWYFKKIWLLFIIPPSKFLTINLGLAILSMGWFCGLTALKIHLIKLALYQTIDLNIIIDLIFSDDWIEYIRDIEKEYVRRYNDPNFEPYHITFLKLLWSLIIGILVFIGWLFDALFDSIEYICWKLYPYRAERYIPLNAVYLELGRLSDNYKIYSDITLALSLDKIEGVDADTAYLMYDEVFKKKIIGKVEAIPKEKHQDFIITVVKTLPDDHQLCVEIRRILAKEFWRNVSFESFLKGDTGPEKLYIDMSTIKDKDTRITPPEVKDRLEEYLEDQARKVEEHELKEDILTKNNSNFFDGVVVVGLIFVTGIVGTTLFFLNGNG